MKKLDRKHRLLFAGEANRDNLKKLADYLSGPQLKTGFTMSQYCSTEQEEATDCGTAGCAVGHGPCVGIPKYEDESWSQYCDRVFTDSVSAWVFMFSNLWYSVDDSAKGAANRIYYVLEHGVPEELPDINEWSVENFLENVNKELNAAIQNEPSAS